MRVFGFVTAVLLLDPIGLAHSHGATDQWTRVNLGTSERQVVAVVVDPALLMHLFAATPRAVLETTDNGGHWEERFRLPGDATALRLTISPITSQTVLLGTDEGLYGSFDGGSTWAHTFRGSGEGEKRVTSVTFQPAGDGLAYLGTAGGLFRSTDSGQHWDELATPPQARDVVDLACDPHNPDLLLVLSSEGLFLANLATGEWRHALPSSPEAEEDVTSSVEIDTNAPDEDSSPNLSLTSLAIDPSNPNIMYVAGHRGIHVSHDHGRTWTLLPHAGMPSPHVARLLLQAHSPVVLYVATEHGMARYHPADQRWEALADGLGSASIVDVAGTPRRLWAASEEGLLQLELPATDFSMSQPPSPQELLANFVHEPTIGQVREAAIRYAEVHPSKIARWRRQAALQALLPSFDIGWDHDISRDTSIDEGSFPNFQVLSTEDRDSGVDFSINWDLGELIWNDDQTSIDVRSKLMVQLREDIVDHVTRTYFERRRLQVQLLTNPPPDHQKLLEQELRLQELTALIDGLTGGDFSRRIGPSRHQEEAYGHQHDGS